MDYVWDEQKRLANIAKHGVDFILMTAFDWHTAIVKPDLRRDYGEARFIAYGWLQDRLYACVFTSGINKDVRIISLRKTNEREERYYEKTIKTFDE
jgi:uncharacterized DUF497 family protein